MRWTLTARWYGDDIGRKMGKVSGTRQGKSCLHNTHSPFANQRFYKGHLSSHKLHGRLCGFPWSLTYPVEGLMSKEDIIACGIRGIVPIFPLRGSNRSAYCSLPQPARPVRIYPETNRSAPTHKSSVSGRWKTILLPAMVPLVSPLNPAGSGNQSYARLINAINMIGSA